MHLVKPPPSKDSKECVSDTHIEVWKGEEAKRGMNDTSVTNQSHEELTQAQNCVNNIHSPSNMLSQVSAHSIDNGCVDIIGKFNIESIPFSCKCFIYCIPWVLPNCKIYLHDIEGHSSYTRALTYLTT